MSEKFFKEVHSHFLAAGYTLNTPAPTSPPKKSSGVVAIVKVCHYKFYFSKTGDFRLEISFGFGHDKETEPLRNIKMYEVLFAERHFVEQLLGQDNVEWNEKANGLLRAVVFGKTSFDVSDESAWAEVIDWALARVKLMDKALLRAFIKFPINQE